MTCNIIQDLKINHLVMHGAVTSVEGNISACREPSMKYLWGRATEYFVPSPSPLLWSKKSILHGGKQHKQKNQYIYISSFKSQLAN